MMNFIFDTPWVMVVILGLFLIGGTVVFGCWLERAIKEILSIGQDEHEDNAVG